MPELDSVRGTAILMVLLYHGLFWSANVPALHGFSRVPILLTQGGWLGVQLFFVLSGLLITGILVDSRERSHYFRRFYTRRARRILPAYLAILLVLVSLGTIQWRFLTISLLFASNLSLMFGITPQYGVLWSLGVEEQFYLFWPLAVRRLSRRQITIFAAAIVLFTPLIRYWAFQNGLQTGLYFYTWFIADGLANGALLALFLRTRPSRRLARLLGAGLVLLGSGIFLAGLRFGILHRTTPVGAALQLAPWHFVFAGVILLVMLLGTGRWKALVTPAWLRYFGRISYGLYLIHLLPFSGFDVLVQRSRPELVGAFHGTGTGLLIRFVIAGGAAIGIAAISRETFEEYFLRRPRPTSESLTGPGI